MCAGYRVNPLRNYATHSSQQDVVFDHSVIVTQHLRSIDTPTQSIVPTASQLLPDASEQICCSQALVHHLGDDRAYPTWIPRQQSCRMTKVAPRA
jgi:hypothetical protein